MKPELIIAELWCRKHITSEQIAKEIGLAHRSDVADVVYGTRKLTDQQNRSLQNLAATMD